MRAFGLLALIGVVAIGAYVYTKQMETATSAAGGAPTTAIDVTAVRTDLLALANAERQYWASNGKYASLDELQSNGGTHVPARPSYSYSAETGETNFKIVARYSGPDPKAPKTIAIDETMAITTN
jgi:uncharacterized protein (UPF0333 family)